MKLFNTVTLETAALCNRSCVFCPNHTTARPDELMPMGLIEKALKELGELKYDGRLETFIYNEPTRDKRLIEILELARRVCPGARPAINTNGDYFKRKEDIEALFDAGLCQMVINVYSAADGVSKPAAVARGISAAAKRQAQLTAWLGSIPGVLFDGQLYNRVPRNSRHARVEAKFGVTPATHQLGSQFATTNRSGLISWFAPPLKEPLKKMCTKPWRMLNINWKGEALVCCNDYHGAHSVGNLNDSTLVDLWNAPKMRAYRVALQNKRRDTPLCHTCDDPGGFYQHMIERVPLTKATEAVVLSKTGAALIAAASK